MEITKTDKMKGLHALRNIPPASLIMFVIYGVLIVGIFYSTLSAMIEQWAMKDDYSYCYLIPFVVLYLIWDKREELLNSTILSSWKGAIFLSIGAMLFWIGELGGEFLSLYISFWLVILGLTWLHLGWRNIKILFFPFLILLTMFPLPNFLYQKVLVYLKLISSRIGVKLMQFYGLSAYREGNIIDIGYTKLQVVDACSGLRYVIPLFVLGLLVTYFFRSAFWKKVVIVLSTIPLSIITNSLRIATTGILYEVWGAQVAEEFFHGFSGWLIFMASLGILVGEMWILGKIVPGKDQSGSMLNENDYQQERLINSSEGKPHGKKSLAVRFFFTQPKTIFAISLLTITLVIYQSVDFREKVPIKKKFDQFPLQFGKWVGKTQLLEDKFLKVLHLSDYVHNDYQGVDGKIVNFYVAYYESQRKAESIHSPETCLPSSGWLFQQTGNVSIPIDSPNRKVMTVNRAIMQQMDTKQLVYFWFPMRGRILTNAYQMKIYTFWDALTRQRTDGALVRVITPLYSEEEIQSAEERLQKFIVDVSPLLSRFLPD